MYKDILRSIAGIEVYPLFSLVVFIVFFTAVLVRVMRMDRGRIAGLAALPLDPPDGACARDTDAPLHPREKERRR